MTFELWAEEAARPEFVEGRLIELRKEIDRTENIAFREDLRKIDARWIALSVSRRPRSSP